VVVPKPITQDVWSQDMTQVGYGSGKWEVELTGSSYAMTQE